MSDFTDTPTNPRLQNIASKIAADAAISADDIITPVAPDAIALKLEGITLYYVPIYFVGIGELLVHAGLAHCMDTASAMGYNPLTAPLRTISYRLDVAQYMCREPGTAQHFVPNILAPEWLLRYAPGVSKEVLDRSAAGGLLFLRAYQDVLRQTLAHADVTVNVQPDDPYEGDEMEVLCTRAEGEVRFYLRMCECARGEDPDVDSPWAEFTLGPRKAPETEPSAPDMRLSNKKITPAIARTWYASTVKYAKGELASSGLGAGDHRPARTSHPVWSNGRLVCE